MFGTAGELRLDPSQRKPVIVNVDTDELAHPNVRTKLGIITLNIWKKYFFSIQ